MFYGRWGGDEFVVCVQGDKSDTDAALKKFYEELATANARKELPFELSIAVGRTDSSKGDPMEPMEAINKADDDMYIDKKRLKAERKD